MPPLRAVARRQLFVAPPVAPQLPSSLAFVSNPLGRPHTSPGRGGVPPTPQIKMRGGVFPYTGKDCTQAGEIIIASGPSTNKTTDRRSPAPDVPSVDPPVPPPRLSFGRTPSARNPARVRRLSALPARSFAIARTRVQLPPDTVRPVILAPPPGFELDLRIHQQPPPHPPRGPPLAHPRCPITTITVITADQVSIRKIFRFAFVLDPLA